MTTATHPAHLRNRIAMAQRFANRVEMMAEMTGQPLAHTVEMLLSLDEEHSAAWWARMADAFAERRPSEATVSATIAILAERVG